MTGKTRVDSGARFVKTSQIAAPSDTDSPKLVVLWAEKRAKFGDSATETGARPEGLTGERSGAHAIGAAGAQAPTRSGPQAVRRPRDRGRRRSGAQALRIAYSC